MTATNIFYNFVGFRYSPALMAEECTNITTIEELSVFCRWVEDGEPVEHFF